VIADLTPGKSGLKFMIHDNSRGIFILADGDGFIHLFSAIGVRNLKKRWTNVV